jgi:purine-binding chemotaxis protein CheW
MKHTLARPEQGQYLGMYVGEEEYGIEILRVREILQYDAITHVPGMPAFVRGVINLRGSVVPVVDLSVKFGARQTSVTGRTCIVIVEVSLSGESLVVGLVADSVSQVIDLRSEDIQPPPALGTMVRVEYLRGMGSIGRKFILLLDIDRILSESELLSVAGTPDRAEQAATPLPEAVEARA